MIFASVIYASMNGFLERKRNLCAVLNARVLIGIDRMFKKDNRIKKHHGRYTILGIVLGISLAFGGFYFYDNNRDLVNQNVSKINTMAKEQYVKEISSIPALQPKVIPMVNTSNANPIVELVPKLNAFSSNSIDEYNIEQLRQIALDDINNYRSSNGVNTIPMNNAKASQLWAEHLLSEGCISHREGNSGPIQRYVDNGDQLQMVYENVAGGYGTNWMSLPDAIKDANSQMMNNDAEQGNGHRNNILNPNHQSLSLGIAYNSDKLVIVEDFQEPNILGWKTFDMSYDDSKSCW